ncbi:Murein hydrolase activator NlpD precursor [compost metagenome]
MLSSSYGERWGRTHKGIDLVSSDRSILAADEGVVVFTGTKSGYGNCIIIDHKNGYETLYGHLSKISVKEGQVVEKGTEIGVMGNTGRSTGTHLHFEIHKDGSVQNPMKYL